MKEDYFKLATGLTRTFAAELKNPLPDFYEFAQNRAEQRAEEDKKALDARLATPESQRDELLKYAQLLLRAFDPKVFDLAVPDLTGPYYDLKDVVNEVERRR